MERERGRDEGRERKRETEYLEKRLSIMESQGERWEANGKEAYLMGANLSLYLIQNRR